MERELSLLKKRLDDSAGVMFCTVGIGPERAYRGIRSLLKPAPVMDQSRALLLLGFAGAVDASLKPGDLILSGRYHQEASSGEAPSPGRPLPVADCHSGSLGRSDDPGFFEPDRWMHRMAVEAVQETALCFTESPSLTVGRVIDSPSAKRAIFDQYSVATVNMEDYWAAAAAQEAGVPFLSVRAVLDVADQRLPGYLASLSLPGSRTVLPTLLHPWRVGPLLGLAVQMRRAQRALAQFALAFIPKMTDLHRVASPGTTPGVGNCGRPLQSVQSAAYIAGSTTGLTR